MTAGVEYDLSICPGDSYSKVFRWGQENLVYKPITAVSNAAPCVVTAVGHGLTAGWPYQINHVKGLDKVNTGKKKYWTAKVVDVDNLEINSLDTTDTAEFGTYDSGGTVSYHEPVDLAGMSARMDLRVAVEDDTAVLSLTDGSGITLDNTAKTITIALTEAQTTQLQTDGYTELVYDLEMVSGATVTKIARGKVTIGREVTR